MKSDGEYFRRISQLATIYDIITYKSYKHGYILLCLQSARSMEKKLLTNYFDRVKMKYVGGKMVQWNKIWRTFNNKNLNRIYNYEASILIKVKGRSVILVSALCEGLSIKSYIFIPISNFHPISLNLFSHFTLFSFT